MEFSCIVRNEQSTWIILAALFVSYINVGGNYMQACNIPVEIIDVISAVIIYFSSFALMIRLYLQNHEKKKHKRSCC